jgi:plastocyanin
VRIRGGWAALVVLATLASAALPAAADGRVRKVVVRQGPFHIQGYQVRYTDPKTRRARAPRMNGYIVKMYARVVDKGGRHIPVRRIMLHHVLYKNKGRFAGDRRDGICGHGGESFYGTGEENQALRLPRGYGYRIRKGDRWQISWMLMNHKPHTSAAYIEYTAWIETKRKLRAVTPYWLRVTGCWGASDPIYNLPGGGAPHSVDRRTRLFRLPRAGMIVAANAHVHAGSKGLLMTQPRCSDRLLMRSRPLYGLPSHPYYHVLPVLHEPGPIATSWSRTAKGIRIGPREPLRLVSLYDAQYQHARVMGIMHLYVWHGRRPRAASCRALPSDLRDPLPRRPGRLESPHVVVPLTGLDSRGRVYTILRPTGPMRLFSGDANIAIGRNSFGIRNLSIPVGNRLRWTDRDPHKRKHNATLANGPEGGSFGSPMLSTGRSWAQRFTIPGTYQIFCTLHPVTMTQTVQVRAH